VTTRLSDRPRQPASARRKIVVMFALAGPIVLVFSTYLFLSYGASRRLGAAIAAADRLDTGWRLAQLIDKRITPQSGANSADVVMSMKRMPPRVQDSASSQEAEKAGAPRGRVLDTALRELESPSLLPPDVAVGLAAEVEARADAIELGRELGDMGEGHHKITYDPFAFNTLVTHVQNTREMAWLLQKDAILRADRGDVNGAIESTRAVLGAARSIGDEPFAVSQLTRMACETVALSTFERALSQGEATAQALARIQADFARDERQPLLLYALRGERATVFDSVEKLSTGEVNGSQFQAAIGADPGPAATAMTIAVRFGPFTRHNQALALEQMNEAVEIAKRPLPDQLELWEQSSSRKRSSATVPSLTNALAVLLNPFGDHVANAYQRTRAQFRVGQAVAACERFRMTNGRWPARLEDLTPAYVASPLVDPYDGKPLRMAQTKGGISIYAVGSDRKDDGGRFHPKNSPLPPNYPLRGYDIGMRLWNVDQRRQPRPEPTNLGPKPAK
jgi:hypothetical protein